MEQGQKLIDINIDENELVRNVATGHADEGILVDGDRNRLINNVSSLNAGDGFEVDGDGNRLAGNRAEDNGSNGIDVQEGELNNIIVGNVALGNPNNDLEDDNPDCDGDLWLNNTSETRSDDCIE